MNKGVFKQARERAAAAAKKADSLQHVRSPDEMKEVWSEFLVNYHRAYQRLGNAMDTPKERGWFERLGAARKKDPLLQYLYQARDADEHGRDEIAKATQGGLAIGTGGGPIYIEKMVIRGGRLEVLDGWQGRPGMPIRAEFCPGELRLEPVTNKGTVYAVPETHLGRELRDVSPAKAASLGLIFLDDALNDAFSRFADH